MIAILRVFFDLSEDLRVLAEDFSHQELLGKGKCLHFRLCQMHELRLQVVTQIVVSEELIRLEHEGQLIFLLI